MSDKPKNLNDIDHFWDLNSLLPKKRPVTPTNRAVNVDTVEFEFNSDHTGDSGAKIPPPSDSPASTPVSAHEQARRLNEIPMRQRARENQARHLEPYLTYQPNSRLIRRVSVSKWETRYNFYEKFREDARRYWNRTASECPHAAFFSYIPQYNQLKYAQLKWYLWWRDNIRRGRYLRTDFSYILLYVYEILNCPDLIPPKEGIRLLCEIWLACRADHRRIDSYLCEWVCDYCLINQLPCPKEHLEPIISDIVAAASFKEFYMDAGTNVSSAASILTYSSTYNWHSSRYVTKENISLFAAHIRGAFDKVYHEVLECPSNNIVMREVTVERDAYNGALCVYDMKRSILIDYISYTRSPKFRFIVTDIIKYSENRIRMALGIKSRLKVEELTDEMRASIDEYFDTHLPVPKKNPGSTKSAVKPENEYEKLYEPTTTALSLDDALKIEQSSWTTTEKLTAAFEENAPPACAPVPEPAPIPEPIKPDYPVVPALSMPDSDGEDDEFASLIASLDDPAVSALRMLAAGNPNGISEAASASGMLADALADKINETAFDIVGDSVIEPDGDGYRLIGDYEGDLITCLK